MANIKAIARTMKDSHCRKMGFSSLCVQRISERVSPGTRDISLVWCMGKKRPVSVRKSVQMVSYQLRTICRKNFYLIKMARLDTGGQQKNSVVSIGKPVFIGFGHIGHFFRGKIENLKNDGLARIYEK